MKFRAEAVDDIEPENKRNVKTGFFHGDVLKGVGFFRGDDVEEGANLTFGEHVLVIRAARAGTSRLASGILNELANFFFQRHFLEELFDAGFRGWIIQLRICLDRFIRGNGLRLREGRSRGKWRQHKQPKEKSSREKRKTKKVLTTKI